MQPITLQSSVSKLVASTVFWPLKSGLAQIVIQKLCTQYFLTAFINLNNALMFKFRLLLFNKLYLVYYFEKIKLNSIWIPFIFFKSDIYYQMLFKIDFWHNEYRVWFIGLAFSVCLIKITHAHPETNQRLIIALYFWDSVYWRLYLWLFPCLDCVSVSHHFYASIIRYQQQRGHAWKSTPALFMW